MMSLLPANSFGTQQQNGVNFARDLKQLQYSGSKRSFLIFADLDLNR
jgi:hypothetical protein